MRRRRSTRVSASAAAGSRRESPKPQPGFLRRCGSGVVQVQAPLRADEARGSRDAAWATSRTSSAFKPVALPSASRWATASSSRPPPANVEGGPRRRRDAHTIELAEFVTAKPHVVGTQPASWPARSARSTRPVQSASTHFAPCKADAVSPAITLAGATTATPPWRRSSTASAQRSSARRRLETPRGSGIEARACEQLRSRSPRCRQRATSTIAIARPLAR